MRLYSGTITVRIQIFADELYKLLLSTWFLITLHELMPFLQTDTMTEVVDIDVQQKVVLFYV